MTNPPAGDLTPVPVHIIGVSDGVAMGAPKPRTKKVRTICRTFKIASSDTDIYPLRRENERRVQTVVIVSTGPGTAANAMAYGWIAENKSDAANKTGTFITAGGTINVPFVLYGTNELWLSIDSGASATLNVSVFDEVEI